MQVSDLHLSPVEVLLFQQLRELFGQDRVLPRLRVSMICGHQYPAQVRDSVPNIEIWSRENSCLFTVIDGNSDPKVVIDRFDGFEESIDFDQVEHQKYLPALFSELGIHYITISSEELQLVCRSGNREGLCETLQKKLQHG